MSVQTALFDAPGPRARRRHAILTVIGVVIAVGVLWVVIRKMGSANQLEGYMWSPFVTDPEVWTQYLLPGLWATLKAAALSVVLAGIFGGPASALSLAIIADVIPPHRRGKAMGTVMGSFALASILGLPAGPLVGKAYKHLLEVRMDHGPMAPEEAERHLRAWWAEQDQGQGRG